MKNYDERVTKMETNKIEISEAEFMRAISHVMTESKIAELTKAHFTLGLSFTIFGSELSSYLFDKDKKESEEV